MFNQNVTIGPGTENFTNHALEIAIMLLGAFLLGFLLKHFLKSNTKNKTEYEVEIINWRSKYNGASSDLSNSLSKIELLESEILSLKNRTEEGSALRLRINELENQISNSSKNSIVPSNTITEELKIKLDACNALNASLHNKLSALQFKSEEQELNFTDIASENDEKTVEVKNIIVELPEVEIIEENIVLNEETEKPSINTYSDIRKDNLTKIEGIGPKIASILNEKGIFTFGHLALSSEAKLRAILDEQGDHYKIHEPGTWPKQADLAVKGDWETLLAWQKELKGGKKRK